MKLSELNNFAMNFDEATYKKVYIGDNKAKADLDTNRRAVWNIQKEKTCAVVSKDYKIVQHREFIQSVVEAISNLNLPANASANNMGNRISVDIEFPDQKIELKEVGEEFISGLRIINSYDKTTGVLIVPRIVRLACANGMVSTRLATPFGVKHVSKLVGDLQKATAIVMKRIINSNDKLQAWVSQCIGDSVEWEILDKIAPSLLDVEKHRKKILQILKEESGTGKITRWDFYNAITNYCTHDTQLKGLVEERLQKKAETVLVTPLAQLIPKETAKVSS